MLGDGTRRDAVWEEVRGPGALRVASATVPGEWTVFQPATPDQTGSVTLDKAGKSGKVEITIDTGSINTGTEAFNKHLQSKDFFNSAEFPTAKFVADKFSFNGDKVSEVQGTLTLLGKTNPVTLKATNFGCYQNPMLKVEVCGGDFETTIVRSQYGMPWGLNFGFSDTVRLVIQAEGIKQP